MKLAFNKSTVEKGGQFENLFYNQAVVPQKRRGKKEGFILVEVDEAEVSFSFLSTNKDSLKWENVAVYVEVPVSYKITNVPTWLPNRTFIDDEGAEQVHTLESWGGVIRENLAGTRMIVKLTQFGDVVGEDFDNLVTFINGDANRIGLTVQETRDLIATAAYTE